MEYQLTTGGVLRKSDNAWIPASKDNTDWLIYLEWVAEGNTPDPDPYAPTSNS